MWLCRGCCYKRDRGWNRVGELVRRVWLTRVYCYNRDNGWNRVGGLVRRVWLAGVYCYKRDRGYYRVGRSIRRLLEAELTAECWGWWEMGCYREGDCWYEGCGLLGWGL